MTSHYLNSKILFFFLVLTGFSACTVYKEYPIDVFKPGEVAVLQEKQNIALISRNFKYTIDTLQHYYKKDYTLIKDTKNQHLNIDSLATVNVLQGLAEQLQSGERFTETEVWPYNVIRSHTGEKLAPFSWETVENLTSPVNADLLISLESLSYFFNTMESTGIDPEVNEVVTAAVWGIYDPVSKKIIEHKQLVDTVYWDGYDKDGKQNSGIPDRIDAIQIASKIAGQNYGKRLSPSWMQVNRMYIIPPVDDFRIAAAKFSEGKLNEAINTWAVYTDKKFRKLAIIACYNIAMAYEMKDDLQKASDWISESEKLAVSLRSKEDLKMILLYKKILSERIKELEKINLN
ncbi:MAG: hypothetical protein JW833_07335 [Prolixibacteraceae bacterium]|nr:hypothetical protein [Prolixibacteraceae bacterium]